MNQTSVVWNDKNVSFLPPAQGLLQRKCACGSHMPAGGECEKCTKNRLSLQREASDRNGESEVPPIVYDVLRSPGRPLDRATRDFLEPRFGHDFSSIRVHVDPVAAQSARAVGARAYTVGQEIAFGAGLYAPSSHDGRKLIAHELAHTLQQSVETGSAASQVPRLRIGASDDTFEREAEVVSSRLTAGEPMERSASAAPQVAAGCPRNPVLQRDEEEGGQKKAESSEEEPLIPMPVFDEFDPVIIAPDIEGIPDFIRGKEVPLSTLKKALDFLRGKKSGATDDRRVCDRIPGMETAELGKFRGQCCKKFKRDEENCCNWRRLSLQDSRCCTKDEVLLPNNKCFKPKRAIGPVQPVPAPSKPSVTFPPPLPPLGQQMPPVRFGTISGMTIDKFAVDSDKVPARFAKDLDHVAALLKIYTDAEIHIEGHTDSTFTDEHNKKLSKKRAEAVKKELEKRGVAASRMKPEGFGEEQLRFPTESTEEEKAGNRRVEIWYYTPPSKTMSEEMRMPIPIP